MHQEAFGSPDFVLIGTALAHNPPNGRLNILFITKATPTGSLRCLVSAFVDSQAVGLHLILQGVRFFRCWIITQGRIPLLSCRIAWGERRTWCGNSD